MKKFLSILIILVVFSSCSEYQKALKNEDVGAKFEAATKQYEKGKYAKAIRLFEQMAPAYRGKPQAEKMFYMYSQSYYKTEQYYLAGYQFESFASSYPKSEKLEEAAFLGAKSYSMLSPVYSIDQTDTTKAIEKLQAFIDTYPNSTYLEEPRAARAEWLSSLHPISPRSNAAGPHGAARRLAGPRHSPLGISVGAAVGVGRCARRAEASTATSDPRAGRTRTS